MPRSFLVKRLGLHHVRPAARSPSPASPAAGPWDAPVGSALWRQDPSANGHINGTGPVPPVRPRSHDSEPVEPLGTCSPVNSNALSPAEDVDSYSPPVVWSRTYVSPEYPDKLCGALADLTPHRHIGRETRSGGGFKSAPLKQECPLCSKVGDETTFPSAHLYTFTTARPRMQPLRAVSFYLTFFFADIFMRVQFEDAHMQESREQSASDGHAHQGRPDELGAVVVPVQGEDVRLRGVRQGVQALLHPLHAPAHPLGHAAVSVPVLRQEVPPEVRHEEAHVHPHRCVSAGEKPHVCQICGKAFSQSSNLITHSRKHRDERPHRCARCLYGFQHKAELRQHQERLCAYRSLPHLRPLDA
ncbi:zinc finger protein 768-like isoform X1 [Betta splendens]|uniref:Zinc finger protein 768-like isoform X1 n=1 Tax=Betta splendens TaxID=158456 RepID=A0A9W2XVM8_BETSP|nr:zinc finger protein 768-like isoform X1 [Betta splendens]